VPNVRRYERLLLVYRHHFAPPPVSPEERTRSSALVAVRPMTYLGVSPATASESRLGLMACGRPHAIRRLGHDESELSSLVRALTHGDAIRVTRGIIPASVAVDLYAVLRRKERSTIVWLSGRPVPIVGVQPAHP
jgi:hypothetical protein